MSTLQANGDADAYVKLDDDADDDEDNDNDDVPGLTVFLTHSPW